MPHVLIKMLAGRSDAQKTALAEAITQAMTTSLGCGDDAVSVSIRDVAPKGWAGVYETDIMAEPGLLFKKPGYGPP